MISGAIAFNYFAKICLILVTKFGDATLLVSKQRFDLKSFPDIYLVLTNIQQNISRLFHDLIFPFRDLTEV